MKMKFLFLLAAFYWIGGSAVTKITMPTDFSSVTSGSRANLKANFSETETRFNAAADSVDQVRGRFTNYGTDFTISSLDALRLRLDTDGSLLGVFVVEQGSTGDSLFRVSEDTTAKFFGKLTVADTLFAGKLSITGAPIFSGLTASRLTATDASKNLSSVSNLASWISGTSNRITVTDDGDGTVTLSGPQDLHTTASPSFTGLTLGGNIQATKFLNDPSYTSAIYNAQASSTPYFQGQDGATLKYNLSPTAATINVNTAITGTLGVSGNFAINTDKFTVAASTGNALVAGTLTVGSLSGVLKSSAGLISGSATTTDLTEGSNLYYTDTRARAAITGTSNRTTVTSGVVDISAAYVGQASITTLGTIGTGIWSGTTIATNKGGTGLTSIGSSNQVLGVNSAAGAMEYKTISGTSNQVTVTHGANSITLSGPQNLHTGASPTFAGITSTSTANLNGDVYVNSDKVSIAGATGNTVIAGILAAAGNFTINTNKFTVAATTGNTAVAGTFGVTGVTSTTGGLANGASFTDHTTSITGTTTLSAAHSTVFATTTGSNYTITLPTAAGIAGRVYTIHWTASSDANASIIKIDPNGSETIDGDDSVSLGSDDFVGFSRLKIISDGANWRALELYEDISFTVNLTIGFSGADPTGTVLATRNGKAVTLTFPEMTGTSDATNLCMDPIPYHLMPPDDYRNVRGLFLDNSSAFDGVFQFQLATNIICAKDNLLLGSSFTASGTKGVRSQTISYSIR